MDDSCRRPGSIPFKWEICPGTPKHARSSSASVPSSYSSSISKAAVAPKLTPPPSMAPSPYHSPRVSYYSARSASVSPSRRRQHRPTAFLDVAPRAAAAPAYGAGVEAEGEAAAVPAYRCFPLPVFLRRDRDGKKGGGSGRRSGTSSSSSSSFGSDGAPAQGRLRRSASSSSSSCLSLSSGRSGKFAEAREVEAATGWFF
ncbi:uncharacterized protein LOC133900568 [Phragmites australis]|uniref:uncharacterized protein LOC133900568 n=1 Tax=Phragmites australis TaxID=29695 RepID=UPI002D799B1F|nr:uncharacterized protein LOC133900568 [Phragmites australis]